MFTRVVLQDVERLEQALEALYDHWANKVRVYDDKVLVVTEVEEDHDLKDDLEERFEDQEIVVEIDEVEAVPEGGEEVDVKAKFED